MPWMFAHRSAPLAALAGWHYLRAPVHRHPTSAAWFMAIVLGVFVLDDVRKGQYGQVPFGACVLVLLVARRLRGALGRDRTTGRPFNRARDGMDMSTRRQRECSTSCSSLSAQPETPAITSIRRVETIGDDLCSRDGTCTMPQAAILATLAGLDVELRLLLRAEPSVQ
jgi:hypothetical protein